MRRNFQRLLFASILSLLCFAMTSYWYHHMGSSNLSRVDQNPVAYIERTRDEIHRRPVTRIIWQLINDGEPVYPGEAIRTSSRGEVRIQFAESSRFIDLESDSLIVITQGSQNEISLDLLDGSAMVNQGAGNTAPSEGPALTLKSGASTVDLSQATASLSKSNGGKIDLRVLKGKAKIENSTGQTQEIGTGTSGAIGSQDTGLTSPSLEILSPKLDQAFSFNPDSQEPVLFSWKGFPPKTLVSLQVGAKRRELKTLHETMEDRVSQKLSSGKHFWKLVAKDPITRKIVAESPIYRLDVVPRLPPVLVSPAANENILKVSSEQKVDFRWVAPAQSQKILLEVSTDPDFQHKVISRQFTEEDHFAQTLPDGDYHIRLQAQFDSNGFAISSKAQKFNFSQTKALPPTAVRWLSPTSGIPLHFVDQPIANLSWSAAEPEKGQRPAQTWRIKWATTETDLESVDVGSAETKETRYKVTFEKPGRYWALIEGVDAQDKVVARSPAQSFELTPLPLLPAPHFLPEEIELNADNQGRLDLKWTAVEGAKAYKVILYDNKGNEKRVAQFTKTSTTLVNLLPGEHKVEVQAIDEHGRASEKINPRAVRVPASSGLLSPKIRKMKVN